MSSDSGKKFCYPVCLACRVAECPKAVLIVDRSVSSIKRDRFEGTLLTCGCLCELPIVLGVLDPTHVKCARHGWQPIEKRSKSGRTEKRRGKGGGVEYLGQSHLGSEKEEKEEPPF